MNRLAYLLILLLISAQLDDAWAVAPDLSSASLADENDEYLPAQRPLHDEESPGQEPAFAGLKLRTADFPLARRGAPFEWSSTTLLPPPSLYVFMSLQI